jgi:hypothetical protein
MRKGSCDLNMSLFSFSSKYEYHFDKVIFDLYATEIPKNRSGKRGVEERTHKDGEN